MNYLGDTAKPGVFHPSCIVISPPPLPTGSSISNNLSPPSSNAFLERGPLLVDDEQTSHHPSPSSRDLPCYVACVVSTVTASTPQESPSPCNARYCSLPLHPLAFHAVFEPVLWAIPCGLPPLYLSSSGTGCCMGTVPATPGCTPQMLHEFTTVGCSSALVYPRSRFIWVVVSCSHTCHK